MQVMQRYHQGRGDRARPFTPGVGGFGAYFKNGFHCVSAPTLEWGPWPGSTTVSGGRVNSFVFMLSISCSQLPPSKSVRPTLPLKSVSPVKTKPVTIVRNAPGGMPVSLDYRKG